MLKTKVLLLAWLLACALLPALLGGCATPTPLDVGAVVVAPRPQIPPMPALVQRTSPKPAGFFQQSLLDYFSSKPGPLTPSISPTPAARPTP